MRGSIAAWNLIEAARVGSYMRRLEILKKLENLKNVNVILHLKNE